MQHEQYPDSYIRGILNTVKTIAMVGVSANTSRPSYFAFKYLLERNFHMIPVNPLLAGQELLGQRAYAKLTDITEPVDMVDIFRGSRHAVPIVQEALAMKPRPQVIWMQLGVRNDEAAALAEENGMKVVMNRCPKIEYGRLSSEIGGAFSAWHSTASRFPAAAQKKASRISDDRTHCRLCDARNPCRRAARSDHGCKSDADLSDHIVRVRGCRSRCLAVRPADVRQHLHADR
jgi:predicted CoA-binding protein